jgi:hypothetical protein
MAAKKLLPRHDHKYLPLGCKFKQNWLRQVLRLLQAVFERANYFVKIVSIVKVVNILNFFNVLNIVKLLKL